MEPSPTQHEVPGRAVFRDVRAADLVYRLYRGPFDLGALAVLARRPVVLAPGLEATLVVLGASHAVELRWGAERATELLACTAPPADAGVVGSFVASAGGERRFELPGLSLRVRVRTVRDDDEQRARLRRLLADPELAERRVAVRFPAGPGAVDGALTLLWADPEAPRIETIHSYPGEGTLVLSETLCDR